MTELELMIKNILYNGAILVWAEIENIENSYHRSIDRQTFFEAIKTMQIDDNFLDEIIRHGRADINFNK